MKRFLSSITALSLCASVFADSFTISDFVATPNTTVNVTIYLTVESDLEGEATSIDIYAPAGCEFPSKLYKGEKINNGGDFSSDLKAAADMRGINVTDDGYLRVSTLDTWLEAGTYEYATFTVTVSESATSSEFTVNNCKIGYTTLPDATIKVNPLNDLTIGAGGYSSYSVCAPVKVTGAKVMFGTLNGDVLTIAGDGDVVPANTGVILKGTEGATVTLEPAETAPTTESALAPAVLPTTVQANKTMVLSTVGGVTGFYVFSGTTIPGNKAYLPSIPSGSRVRIEEEGATGIESIEAETNGFNYNLMGQQVKSQKGIMIENGKKVIRF